MEYVESTTRNIRRLFVVQNNGAAGWTSVDRTVFTISLENDWLRVVKKSGRDMFPSEINTAIGRLLQEYRAEFEVPLARYRRQHRYRFCYRTGQSGCQDTFIEVDKGDGFPERKFLFHESCYGKCSGFECFAYDFLDLCVAEGFLADEDGTYVYHQEQDAGADVEMTIVKPRLLGYEHGWNTPWTSTPRGAVPLEVCLEVPEPEDEPDPADAGD